MSLTLKAETMMFPITDHDTSSYSGSLYRETFHNNSKTPNSTGLIVMVMVKAGHSNA